MGYILHILGCCFLISVRSLHIKKRISSLEVKKIATLAKEIRFFIIVKNLRS